MRSTLLVLLPFALVIGPAAAVAPPCNAPLWHHPPVCLSERPIQVPEVRLGLTFHHVRLRVPCERTVVVREMQPVRVVRKVIREVVVPRTCTEMVYIPCVTFEPRTVLVEERHPVVEMRPVIVREDCLELVTRNIIREVRVQKPCTRQVYVGVTTREARKRTVYAEEFVKVPRTVSVVRVQTKPHVDPVTGKVCPIDEPVCETRQVVDTVKQVVLRDEVAMVPVTRYCLETRTCLETVKEYRPCVEQALVRVPRYRKEMQPQLVTVKRYCPRTQMVSVKHHRLETHTVTRLVKEYVPCEEEAIVMQPVYRLEKRTCVETVDRYVPCHSEILVPRCVP